MRLRLRPEGKEKWETGKEKLTSSIRRKAPDVAIDATRKQLFRVAPFSSGSMRNAVRVSAAIVNNLINLPCLDCVYPLGFDGDDCDDVDDDSAACRKCVALSLLEFDEEE